MEGVALQSRVGSTHHLYLGTRHPARSTQHSRAPLRGIKRCRALSDDDDKPGPEDGTSSIVQDALVGMIRLEIGKKQVCACDSVPVLGERLHTFPLLG